MRILVAVLALAGCTVPEREAPYTTDAVPAAKAGGFECDAALVQYGIGKTTSTALARKLMAKSGATVLRWVPPRSAVTMDFNAERLNIGYDDDMIITRVSCG